VSNRTGIVGAVVQRSLADWPVVLAAWLLLVCATTLLATGVVYGDAVAIGGLQRALLAAPPAGRAMDVTLLSDVDRIADLDAAIRPELAAAMSVAGGEIVRIARSGSFADAAIPAADVHDLTVLQSVDGIESRGTRRSGVWPTAGNDPVQAALSDAAAREMGVAVGDRLPLVSRDDPTVRIDIVISGVWKVDPGDAIWLGEELQTTGRSTTGTFTTRGPLVIREADLSVLPGASGRAQVSWRGAPTIANLRVEGVDALHDGAANLATTIRAVAPAGTSPRVTTSLPALLDDVGRSVLVSRSGVILLTIQFAVLAGYAIVLVAGMLVERRRSEIALLRSRGASAVHLVTMAVIESAVLAVPAAALAPFLALGVVGLLGMVGPTAGLALARSATISQNAFVVAAVAGMACMLALTLPTLFVSASPAGARAATGRQARTTLAQRLGLDVALVAVAAVALWQLRLYGAPLTRNVRGTLGLDPLLVAAPAIGLVGGAVLALRVVPRIAEVAEQFLVRGRGLVGSLGGRQLARRPLRYTRSALLLMLAAALGTLASAHAATWTRSQVDQADYQAAADVRAIAAPYSSLQTWAAGPTYRAIPGVVDATPLTLAPFTIGRTVTNATLAGIDPVAIGRIAEAGPDGVAGRDASASAPTDGGTAVVRALAPLVAELGPETGVALPGAPARLALIVDVAFRALQNPDAAGDDQAATSALPPGLAGFSAALVIRDGDGRLFRTPEIAGSLAKAGQRLVFDLADPAAAEARPSGPLALEAVELLVAPSDPIVISGTAEIVGLEATDTVTGTGGWTPVGVDGAAPGWSWDRSEGGQRDPFVPAQGRPNGASAGTGAPIFGGFGSGVAFRLFAAAGSGDGGGDVVVPVVASDALLARTEARVGDELTISTRGAALKVRIVGSTAMFAPFDPAVPLLLADVQTLDAIRYVITGQTQQADQWWIRVAPGAEAGVLAALREERASTATVIGRDELARELSTDPVPLGLIGILGLGSLAAMLFAGIGFLVSSTISTSERIGEFALLRALGMSSGQLSLWLSIESVFLLVVGLIAGSVLGLLLAWLVLPFATLTQTGLAPIPAPVVMIPWQALLPPYLAAVILFILSLWLVRRQLPDIRISGVLRARDS
jgi:hypothetical protein